jgi:CubicO group peptidase (beta-lactamase class C family)
VEGADLDAVVRKYVTGPLGLSSMAFDLSPEQRDLLVTPYADGKPAPVRIPDEGMRVRFPDGVPVYAGLAGINLAPARVFDKASFRSGGGGMVGNAPDMLTFVETIRTGGGPILLRDTVATMMTVQTGDFLIVNRGPGWAFGYGGSPIRRPRSPRSRPAPTVGAACGDTRGSSTRRSASAWCRSATRRSKA